MEYNYQWEYVRDNPVPHKRIQEWESEYGPVIIARDEAGKATAARFQLLIDNPHLEVYITGTFNDWEQERAQLADYRLEPDEHHVRATIELAGVSHKDEYKFLVHDTRSGEVALLEDPAGVYFTDAGNSVLWDFDDPSCYTMQHPLINNFQRATKIMQTDLPGLIVHYANRGRVHGKDIASREYYRFIAESGVAHRIKQLGFNAVQFLPFAQAIDGDNWKFRYLVPFQYAIQKNWGTPDDFARMIDAFHAEGIAVIGDFVLGHIPDRDFNVFGQSDRHHGIHLWKRADGYEVYVKDETSWGSRRIDFDNPYVRQFFIGSLLHFLKRYRIDGYRIDNIDGIIRFGSNGDGEERPHGRTFLRELARSVYSYHPAALLHYEAHYYYGDNAQLLVAPLDSSERALGATAYNSSRLTYDFHTKYMFLASDEYSVWRIKHIVEEMEWGKSNSTVADFHNHDAAAGLMDMRCTGSYAYDAMSALNPHNHVHIVGKIKAMESVISFCCEGRTLDLLQTFLLQRGTFEHDSSVHWHALADETVARVVHFKQRVNELLDIPAFWPLNVDERQYLNVDDKNKVLVVERSDDTDRYVVVINMSAWTLHNYKVGLRTTHVMRVIFNSDNAQYGGSDAVVLPDVLENVPSTNFELLDREVELPMLPPYATIVLKEIHGS